MKLHLSEQCEREGYVQSIVPNILSATTLLYKCFESWHNADLMLFNCTRPYVSELQAISKDHSIKRYTSNVKGKEKRE